VYWLLLALIALSLYTLNYSYNTVGIESLTSLMYIAEVAKPSICGMLVSACLCVAHVLCQFAAGIANGVLAPFGMGWRFMLGFAIDPGTVMFVGS
jgi:hypothetical protein